MISKHRGTMDTCLAIQSRRGRWLDWRIIGIGYLQKSKCDTKYVRDRRECRPNRCRRSDPYSLQCQARSASSVDRNGLS